MGPFTQHTGTVAVMDRADVDTDQIIPKEFLKRIERTGYGRFLFNHWRFDENGDLKADFELNRPEAAGASILIAGRNFGCGSSREHAAWALRDYGFRVIIAESFADIFQENADQNGLLAITLPADQIGQIKHGLGPSLTVDLEVCTVIDDAGFLARFTVDGFRRDCLLQGLDRIGLTLQHAAAIQAFEDCSN
jgi:3-isopropylmalate/(R)-2-methylmalate dehydratase small subunit